MEENEPLPNIGGEAKRFAWGTPHAGPLQDSGYFGVFHGFLYTRNLKHREIQPFELEIGEDATVQMTIQGRAVDVSGEVRFQPEIYRGTAVLLEKAGHIYILLENEDGLSCVLYLEYRHYNTTRLYFRKGVVLTAATGTDKPLLENFVLFRNRISEENVKKYIGGLLALTGDSFYISDAALAELRKDYEMASFFEAYQYHWMNRPVTGYRISMEQVLRSVEDPYDTAEMNRVLGALLRMAEKAQAPERIEYAESQGMSVFAKFLLQQ